MNIRKYFLFLTKFLTSIKIFRPLKIEKKSILKKYNISDCIDIELYDTYILNENKLNNNLLSSIQLNLINIIPDSVIDTNINSNSRYIKKNKINSIQDFGYIKADELILNSWELYWPSYNSMINRINNLPEINLTSMIPDLKIRDISLMHASNRFSKNKQNLFEYLRVDSYDISNIHFDLSTDTFKLNNSNFYPNEIELNNYINTLQFNFKTTLKLNDNLNYYKINLIKSQNLLFYKSKILIIKTKEVNLLHYPLPLRKRNKFIPRKYDIKSIFNLKNYEVNFKLPTKKISIWEEYKYLDSNLKHNINIDFNIKFQLQNFYNEDNISIDKIVNFEPNLKTNSMINKFISIFHKLYNSKENNPSKIHNNTQIRRSILQELLDESLDSHINIQTDNNDNLSRKIISDYNNEIQEIENNFNFNDSILYVVPFRFQLEFICKLVHYLNLMIKHHIQFCIILPNNLIRLINSLIDSFLDGKYLIFDNLEISGTILTGFNRNIHKLCIINHDCAVFVLSNSKELFSDFKFLYIDNEISTLKSLEKCCTICSLSLLCQANSISIVTSIPPTKISELQEFGSHLSLNSIICYRGSYQSLHYYNYETDSYLSNAISTINEATKYFINNLKAILCNDFNYASEISPSIITEKIQYYTQQLTNESIKKNSIVIIRQLVALHWIVETISKLIEEDMHSAVLYLEKIEYSRISKRFPILKEILNFLRDYSKYRINDSNPRFNLFRKIISSYLMNDKKRNLMLIITKNNCEFASIEHCILEMNLFIHIYKVRSSNEGFLFFENEKQVSNFSEGNIIILTDLKSISEGLNINNIPIDHILIGNISIFDNIPKSLAIKMISNECTITSITSESNSQKVWDDISISWIDNFSNIFDKTYKFDLLLNLENNTEILNIKEISILENFETNNENINPFQAIIVTDNIINNDQLLSLLREKGIDIIERNSYYSSCKYGPDIILSPKSCIVLINSWPESEGKESLQILFETLSSISIQFISCFVIFNQFTDYEVSNSIEIESYCLSLNLEIFWYYSRSYLETSDIILDLIKLTTSEVDDDAMLFDYELEEEKFLSRGFGKVSLNPYLSQILLSQIPIGEIVLRLFINREVTTINQKQQMANYKNIKITGEAVRNWVLQPNSTSSNFDQDYLDTYSTCSESHYLGQCVKSDISHQNIIEIESPFISLDSCSRNPSSRIIETDIGIEHEASFIGKKRKRVSLNNAFTRKLLEIRSPIYSNNLEKIQKEDNSLKRKNVIRKRPSTRGNIIQEQLDEIKRIKTRRKKF